MPIRPSFGRVGVFVVTLIQPGAETRRRVHQNGVNWCHHGNGKTGAAKCDPSARDRKTGGGDLQTTPFSDNRVLVELIEQGIEAQKEKEKAFFDLAHRFREARSPKEVGQLGAQLGRFVFGE